MPIVNTTVVIKFNIFISSYFLKISLILSIMDNALTFRLLTADSYF